MPAETAKAPALQEAFRAAVTSSWTGIRINTDEITDALDAIATICKRGGWSLNIWDKTHGLSTKATPAPDNRPAGMRDLAQPKQNDGLAAIQAFLAAPAINDTVDHESIPQILVMKNLGLCFGKSPEINETLVSAIQTLIEKGQADSKFLVGLMPAETKLPAEITPLLKVIDHKLPDIDELADIAQKVEIDGVYCDNETAKTVAKAALGLARKEAEGVFAESVGETGKLDPVYVWKEKAKRLNAENLVTLQESTLTYANIGGLHGLKAFNKALLRHDPLEDEDPDVRYRGIVVCGAPGVGKSMMAYATGNEFGIPTVLVNIGSLMNKWVGDTERNTRRLFEILDRLAPCVAVLDEVGQMTGEDNSGIMQRMVSSFLTAMNDMTAPVFWFMTANNIENMHEALLRAERIDAKIYVRLPDAAQRAEVWKIYIPRFFPKQIKGEDDPRWIDIDANAMIERASTSKKLDSTKLGHKIAAAMMTMHPDARPGCLASIKEIDPGLLVAVTKFTVNDEGWTPAEIKACCRLSRRLRLPLSETAKKIGHVCLGVRGKKMLERLDKWALNDGAIDAETGELFIHPSEEDDLAVEQAANAVAPRRKIRR